MTATATASPPTAAVAATTTAVTAISNLRARDLLEQVESLGVLH